MMMQGLAFAGGRKPFPAVENRIFHWSALKTVRGGNEKETLLWLLLKAIKSQMKK